MNEKILVISNHNIIFDRIKLLFNRRYHCCLLNNVNDAKEYIHKSSSPIDLIFIDDDNLQDNMTGIKDEMCYCLPDIPLIFLSSIYTKSIINSIMHFNNCHCIVKPFNNKTMIDKIVSILGEKAIKVFNKRACHFNIFIDEKGYVGSSVLIEIELSDRKYQPIVNETIRIEVYNNPGVELLFAHTDSKGKINKSLEIHNKGKIQLIAYIEDNPNFEKNAAIFAHSAEVVTQNIHDVSNAHYVNEIKQAAIFLFTSNNDKYNYMLKNINYDVHGTIKSISKIAEIININRKEDLPVIEKQYINKTNIIIQEFNDTHPTTTEIIDINEQFNIDQLFFSREILKRWNKWGIIS